MASRTTQTVSVVITVVLLQIRFQPNDHKTIKETADELKIFEGIKHPNLVRYFGVELHRVSSSCQPAGHGAALPHIPGLPTAERNDCLLSEIKSQTLVVGPASRALLAILAGTLPLAALRYSLFSGFNWPVWSRKKAETALC